MCSYKGPLTILLILSLFALTGLKASKRVDQGVPKEAPPPKGFRVERIEQKRTEMISWIRVQVVANTETEETWAALRNIDDWPRHLRIFSGIRPVARTETMTRYKIFVSPPWPIRDFESVIWMATLPEQRLMLWRSDKDDLQRSHGRIEVREIDGGTRVSYEMHSPLRSAYPPWVVRIGLYLILPGIAQDFYDYINK